MPVLDGNFEAFVTNLGKYNEDAAIAKGYSAEGVISRLISGDVSVLDELSFALLEPTMFEYAKAYIEKNYSKEEFLLNYPLLSNKIQAMKSSEIISLLERKVSEFEEKSMMASFPEKATETQILLFKVEASLKYWKDINLAKKAAEKAAKKAAKKGH